MNNDLKQYSLEELQEEIRIRSIIPIPSLVSNPNLEEVKHLCIDYLEDVKTYKHEDKDLEHQIFEAALKACYGEDVFGWIDRVVED